MIGTKLSFKEDIEKEFEKFVEEIEERKMTDAEMAEREEIVKKMKPKLQSFKDRYGVDAEKVMYATATKQAMEDVEIDEKWEVGVVYHQDFGGGEISYFRADSLLKNKRWKGMSVDEYSGKQKKPRNITADEKTPGWKITPKNEIPKGLKEEVEIDEMPNRAYMEKINALIKNHSGKFKWKDEVLYVEKEIEKDVTSRIKSDGLDVPPIKVSKNPLRESKEEIDELVAPGKKSATGYILYHKDFSSAMQHAYDHAKSKGHVVDPKEIDDKVATGPKKPSKGKVNRYALKAGRKTVQIQVTNLDNKAYELNMYIEGVEEGHKVECPKCKGEGCEHCDGKGFHMVDETTNSVGGGNVAGLGVGAQGEPGARPRKKKKKNIKESVQMSKFAGKDVFIVDSDTYHACRLGKKRYARYETYVGKDKIGLAIREYGLKYPKRPIILQNGDVGPMLYLKYGRS
jgi:hypothetical protein